MHISIVLATYKRPEILHRTLESFSRLENNTLQWDVWVIDNAGDPTTKAVVELWSEKLPLNYLVELKNGKNNALNFAIPEIKGDLVVFADDDIIAAHDWLREIYAGTNRWKDDNIFGGRILPYWPEGFDVPDLSNPYLIGAYGIADWNIAEGYYELDKIFGANMIVRRQIFDNGWRFEGDVGPTQQRNYVMGSETEFLMRLKSHGYRFVYLPNVLVYHQIRPEQMNFAWLKKRAYRAGLGGGNSEELEDVPKLLGIPRWLLKQVVLTWFKLQLYSIIFSKKRFEVGMRLNHILGQISKHWELSHF